MSTATTTTNNTGPDLLTLPKRTPLLERYVKNHSPDPVCLPTALYTIVPLSDEQLRTVQRIAEDEYDRETGLGNGERDPASAPPGRQIAIAPPCASGDGFVGQPLSKVLEFHLSLLGMGDEGDGEEEDGVPDGELKYDPYRFVVVADEDWEVRGLGVKVGEEREGSHKKEAEFDGEGGNQWADKEKGPVVLLVELVDDMGRYVPGWFRFRAMDVAMVIANLSVANMSFDELKEYLGVDPYDWKVEEEEEEEEESDGEGEVGFIADRVKRRHGGSLSQDHEE